MTTYERQFKILTAKKETLYTIIQTLYDLSKNLTTDNTIKKFTNLYQSMDSTRTEILKILDEINAVGFDVDENYKPDFQVMSVINEMCCEARAAYTKLKPSTNIVNPTLQQSTQQQCNVHSLLPKITIPDFHGEPKEWETFYSIYKPLVHDNFQLTDADKARLLVSHLKGSALSICAGIATSGDNYDTLWKALLEKYHNKRLLANTYLQQIFNFKSLQSESEKNLNSFLEIFDASVNALKKLDVPDLTDFILLYHALSKLDRETVKSFENHMRGTVIPTYTDLIKFVKDQTKILHNSDSQEASSGGYHKNKNSKSFFVSQHENKNNNRMPFCVLCKKSSHFLGRCDKFKAMNPTQRYDLVKNNNLCFLCFSQSHGVRQCLKRPCAQCAKNHHFLLCAGKPEIRGAKENNQNNQPNSGVGIPETGSNNHNSGSVNCAFQNSSFLSRNQEKTVLLATVTVCVLNSPLQNATARFILDNGSQCNLLTTECCKKLGLRYTKINSSVQGLGQNSQSVRGVTDIIIASRFDQTKKYDVQALVIDHITDKLPKTKLNLQTLSEFKNLQLADDKFFEPKSIDGIIGAQFFPILFGGNRILSSSGLGAALETTFGYVIMGQVDTEYSTPINLLTLREETSIEQILTKFWELEQVPKREIPDLDAIECENIYKTTVSRDISGRFTVALPFKSSPKNLGNSRVSAENRLKTLEKRLTKSDSLRADYNKIMQDFLDQGYLKLLEKEDCDLSYYISHHPVIKLESLSTPIRIVLDASCPSDSDVSLNDLLHSGPKLQADICTLLINFRLFPVALSSDLKKMFLQIKLVQDHWRFQRILWRFDPNEEIKTYEFTVVAFGLRSSPFLALRTVQQLINEDGKDYPLAKKYISSGLYMDDFLTSVPDEIEAKELYNQSVKLFKGGCFDLVKWSTNLDNLLSEIPLEKRLQNSVTFKSETKVLGMQWDPQRDVLNYRLTTPDKNCTKRKILSLTAKCYDPIGLIAPFILHLKLMIRELWQLKLGWDDSPPDTIKKSWEKVCNEWQDFSKFEVPRHVGAMRDVPIMILGFADASQDGYGGVVYLRVVNSSGEVSVRLVAAKSRCAPLKKTMTIPKLELCAALLLSSLLKLIFENYSKLTHISQLVAYSDSTTVVSWLTSANTKDIFVANRVQQIKENLPNISWQHIEGKNNPADCLSRGLTPSQLINHELWLQGPSWIKLRESDWPSSILESDISEVKVLVIEEEKQGEKIHPLLELVERHSSWHKILRITVRVLMLLKLIPVQKLITATALRTAECYLIQLIQLKHFETEIKMIKENKQCKTQLKKLRPFLQDGLLMVGGRLNNSSLSFSGKHPLILPGKETLVERIVDFYHIIYMHTGAYLLEALLRQKYWILGARNLIRNRVFKCNRCFRNKPKILTPLMADLPVSRVTATKPFLHVGVDYFGPINITLGKKRNAAVHKSYCLLAVCLSTKAVHLELVSSLSTPHFMQAFKRLLARRGPCKVLYSDQGSSFVCAKTVLSEINRFASSEEYQNALLCELNLNGVEWKFISPQSPSHGGLWESNVKSAKSHLYKVIGDQLLTYEELNTLLIQIEAILNSRPLCRRPTDSSQISVLTPSHFLNLTPLGSLPADDLTDLNINRLDRFQLIDRMVQDFWKRWRLEYLTTLQTREKWNIDLPNVKIGTVVILKVDNVPTLCWPLAIVTEVHPGKDGVVRNVTVKTSKGTFTRPVLKLCPLPNQ